MNSSNGEWFRKKREDKGMPRSELAKISGVSERTILRIECHNFPARPSTLRQLAHALGVKYKEFLPPRTSGTVDDGELVDLGVSICEGMAAALRRTNISDLAIVSPEEVRGKFARHIDLKTTGMAMDTCERFTKARVEVRGEDVSGPPDPDAEVVAVLDALDGTEHWVIGGGANLWCSAVSFFVGPHGNRSLRVSVLTDANGQIYYARRDLGQAFVVKDKAEFLSGEPELLAANLRKCPRVDDISNATACTVARRPGHWQALLPYLSTQVPFRNLHAYGGNPVLCGLVRSGVDIVFQLNKKRADTQPLWDFVPGMHVAISSGCFVTRLDGSKFDFFAEAEKNFHRSGDAPAGYIAAVSESLCRQTARWLARAGKKSRIHRPLMAFATQKRPRA